MFVIHGSLYSASTYKKLIYFNKVETTLQTRCYAPLMRKEILGATLFNAAFIIVWFNTSVTLFYYAFMV